MKLKTLILALGATFGLTFATTSAHALSVADILAANPVFLLEDDSVEAQNVDQGAAGPCIDPNGCTLNHLDEGDTLRGIVNFPQILTPTGSVEFDDNGTSLGAYFEIVVTKKTAVGGGLFDFEFGAYAPFAAELELQQGLGAGTLTGAMVAFYEDPVDDIVRGAPGCTTPGAGNDCEANVIDGTLVLVLGFDDLNIALGDVEKDEAWQARNAPDDTTAGLTQLESTPLGQFAFQLAVLKSSIGEFLPVVPTPIPVVGGDGKIAWTGSGSILGTLSGLGGSVTPYDFTDDSDLLAVVPEPGTLGLMGAGLLALAGFARRRFRKAA